MKPQEQKRREGEERNTVWESMTPTEQLRDLDRRLGPGVGATRQRKMLAALLEGVPASGSVIIAGPDAVNPEALLPRKKFKKGTKQRA
jgi:hypothetical protein